MSDTPELEPAETTSSFRFQAQDIGGVRYALLLIVLSQLMFNSHMKGIKIQRFLNSSFASCCFGST